MTFINFEECVKLLFGAYSVLHVHYVHTYIYMYIQYSSATRYKARVNYTRLSLHLYTEANIYMFIQC